MTNYPLAIDGYSSLPILIDLVSPVRANDVNRLRNAVVAVEKELGVNPSGTYSTVRARLDAMESGILTGSGGGSGSCESAVFGFDYLSVEILSVSDGTQLIIPEILYDGYIYSVTTKSTSGTCNLTVKVSDTLITGSNSVSTTETTVYHTPSDMFVAGDSISVVLDSNAACTDLLASICIFITSTPNNVRILTPSCATSDSSADSSSSVVVNAANLGTGGIGVYDSKSSGVLGFRNINAGSSKISVSLDSPNKEIDLDVIESALTLNNIGGTLSIAKGGTGQITASAAFNALAPTTTKGDIIVRNATTNVRLGVGTDGYLLIADSTQAGGIRWGSASFIGANTALSNLAATSINQSLIPGTDDGLDLGSSALRWRDLYLGPTSLRLVSTVGETGTARSWRIKVRETAGSTQGSLVIQEASTEYLYLTAAGNIGIGVTDPSSILDINGATTYRGISAPSNAPSGQGRIYFDTTTNHLRFSENGGTYQDFGTGAAPVSGANTSLSNLTSTNINTSLIPAADDGYDLGLSTQRWRDIYLGPTSLHLVSNAAETGTARDWRMAVAEAAGSTRGRLRIMEGSTEFVAVTTSGSVGIGTTAPGTKLDIQDSVDTTMRVRSTNPSSSNDAAFEIDRGRQGNSRSIIRLLTAGVSDWYIGMFNYGNASPTGSELLISSTGQGSTDAQFSFIKAGRFGVGLTDPSRDIHARKSSTATVAIQSENTNTAGVAQVIAQSGNVDGYLIAHGTTHAGTVLGLPGANKGGLISAGSAVDGMVIGTTRNIPIHIGNNNLERIRVTADGYVGIGTTSTNEILTIEGALSLKKLSAAPALTSNYGKLFVKSSDGYVYYKTDTGQEYSLITPTFTGITGTGAADQVAYWSSTTAQTGSSTFVWKQSTQRVGIGTTNPQANANIYSATNADLRIDAGSTSTAKVNFATNGTVRADIAVDDTQSGTPLNLNRTSIANVVLVAGGGNVGFGNIDPLSKIDLDGATTWRGQGSAPPVAPAGQGRIYFSTADSKLKISESGGAYFDISAGIAANITLSNLTTTSINTSLLPQDGYDLGSSSAKWRDLYLNNSSFISATVNTTDGYAATLQTISTASNKVYLIESRVVGRRTGGASGATNDSAAFITRVTAKNSSGSVSLNTSTTEYTFRDQAIWDTSYTISGSNVLLRVTGASNNNITWIVTSTIQLI